MVDYEITNVTTKEQLDVLYNNSAFTMEGLAEDSIPDLMNWLEKHNAIEKQIPNVHIIKGKLMNNIYELTGNNTYNDDLTIISVLGINLLAIVYPRFEIGGRWFDDVVDNNLRRQRGE